MNRHTVWALSIALTLTALGPALPGKLAAAEPAPPIPAGCYTLDRSHSTLVFRVSHIGFSFYTGSFARFDAELQFDPEDFSTAELTASVDVSSLQLPAPPAGFLGTLLGADWFDTDKYPQITYRSTAVEKTGPDTARVTGELTLHGRTRPVVLDLRFNGGYAGLAGLDPNARIGFSARGKLLRSEFGMTTGIPPAGTTLGVGDEVEFIIETEFTGPPLRQ